MDEISSVVIWGLQEHCLLMYYVLFLVKVQVACGDQRFRVNAIDWMEIKKEKKKRRGSGCRSFQTATAGECWDSS